MKKIYMTTGILMLSATFTFGQRNIMKNMPTKAKLGPADQSVGVLKNTNTNQKAAGDIIWSEDFTGGVPAGWTFGGTTNAGADWQINSTTVTGTYTNATPIASGSGGNHMLYFGEAITPIADRDAYFQTTAIALTGQSSVTVRFDQKFRLCCASTAALNLVVSTDAGFTTTQTYDARGAVAINAQSADPLTTAINITDFVGGYTGNIYLRFHWASGASHYYWMVDDIEVLESENNDLITYDEYYGSALLQYTQVPVNHISPFDFSTFVTNVGAVNQTNTMLTVDVNSGVFTGTSATTTVNAMTLGGSVAASSDSLGCTTQFTPPASVGGPYTVSLTVSSDSTDITPGNNTFSFPPIEVTQYTYALDDNSATPGNGGGFDESTTPASEEFEAGNFFDTYANDNVSAIDVFIGSNSPVGAIIDAVLYDVSSGSYVEIARSTPVTLTAGDIGTMMTLVLPTKPAVTAGGFYFAAVHAFGSTGEFFYGTSGSSPDGQGTAGQASLIFYPNMSAPAQSYYTSATPMVRLNFDPTIGVEELASENVEFSVYPNPSNGVFTLNLNSDVNENVALNIRNVVGQNVITKTITVAGQTTETINLTNFSKGIYFLTVGSKTTKLIVE
jgi:hypothetical protein